MRFQAMFTIDLLHGKAIPPKSRPGGLVIMALTAVMPVAAAMVMFVLYMNNDVAASLRQKEMARLDTEIGKLSDAVELQNALKKEKSDYSKSLSEVRSSIRKHTQWSPVLTTLIENLPDSVILTSLKLEYDSVRKKVPKKDNPKKKVEISIPVRILSLTVAGGYQGNCDQAVKDFMGRLWDSESLGPKLEKIGHSQEHVKLDDQQLVSYQISCRFKPGL